jgi:hypothetical protein
MGIEAGETLKDNINCCLVRQDPWQVSRAPLDGRVGNETSQEVVVKLASRTLKVFFWRCLEEVCHLNVH